MFDNLIDNVNADKWQELDVAAKNEAEWIEYQVTRHCKQLNESTIVFQVAPNNTDGDPKSVQLKDCLPKKNPLKEIHIVELKLNADGTEIIGIDLNGDIIVRK